MKRLIAVVVVLCLAGLTPLAALDGLEATTLSISAVSFGLGGYLVFGERTTAARLLGIFYIGIGILGVVGLGFGMVRGDLLDQIRS